jgi:hypothetical protein
MLRMLSAFALKDCLLKSWPELQMRIMQLAREGSPAPGLRLPQAELSRKPNQIARGRIRRFESDMASQAVGLTGASQVATCTLAAGDTPAAVRTHWTTFTRSG